MVHGSTPGTSYMCCGWIDFCWTPNCASVSLILLPALWTIFYCWVALYSFSVRAFALSYYIMFCPVWFLSFGGLLFFGRGCSGSRSMGKGWYWSIAKGAGRSRGRGNYGQDALYHRIIYFQLKKSFQWQLHIFPTNWFLACISKHIGKHGLFNKQCWENCISIHRRLHLISVYVWK